MANITKLKFAALDISSKNYLLWTLDAKIHFNAMNLEIQLKKEMKRPSRTALR